MGSVLVDLASKTPNISNITNHFLSNTDPYNKIFYTFNPALYRIKAFKPNFPQVLLPDEITPDLLQGSGPKAITQAIMPD